MSKREEALHEEVFGHGHVTQIDSRRRTIPDEFREIWAYRDLLVLLVQRDVSLQYKQSVIGAGWAIAQPLLAMLIFTVVFGMFARLPSGGKPYAVFTMCALVPWALFARALNGASASIVGASSMITKVYFPRIILPISKTIAGIVDFLVAFCLLVVLLVAHKIQPSMGVLMLPFFVLIALATALGVGLWLTALNVRYRDIGLVVPFLIQIWMYASPVAYSAEIVPRQYMWIYSLNPMFGVAEGFRWALLGNAALDAVPLLISCSVVVLLLASGYWYFRRTEREFADTI